MLTHECGRANVAYKWNNAAEYELYKLNTWWLNSICSRVFKTGPVADDDGPWRGGETIVLPMLKIGRRRFEGPENARNRQGGGIGQHGVHRVKKRLPSESAVHLPTSYSISSDLLQVSGKATTLSNLYRWNHSWFMLFAGTNWLRDSEKEGNYSLVRGELVNLYQDENCFCNQSWYFGVNWRTSTPGCNVALFGHQRL